LFSPALIDFRRFNLGPSIVLDVTEVKIFDIVIAERIAALDGLLTSHVASRQN
jgi:hypothetical protein